MKIIISHDESPFIKRVSRLVKKVDKNIEVVIADSFSALITACNKEKDVSFIISDFAILGKEWRKNLKRLITASQGKRLVFVSSVDDREIVNYLMLSGCYGFIPSDYDDETFSIALSLIIRGHEYVPPIFLHGRRQKMSSPIDYRLPDGKFLTPRQVEVLELLGEGMSNKQIAFKMDVSEATVKLHINALLKNLEVDNRTQAVVSAQRLGFI
jgi:Response regulator containing a CheY-like receiver domain and an HTH DNA-binding domain